MTATMTAADIGTCPVTLAALEHLAVETMADEGLDDWTFRWDNARRRAGQCDYAKRTISLSKPLFSVKQNIDRHGIDTVLHEIAHATAGALARHGPRWKAEAIRLGANPVACTSSADWVMPPGSWQATCDGCGHVAHKYRRPKRPAGWMCRCGKGGPMTFEKVAR